MSDSYEKCQKTSLAELLPLIEEKLRIGGEVKFNPRGISMLPLIRQFKDSVSVASLKGELCRGDVIFYRRPDGQFVLHRIVGEDKDGYILCGDNQLIKEHGVKKTWIIGVMTAVWRDGKKVSCTDATYKVYKNLILPLWVIWLKTKSLLSKLKKAIKKS